MPSEEIAKSIKKASLRHQDESLLYTFLNNYSEPEQKDIALLANKDEHFWLKLAVRIRVVSNELRNGSTSFLRREITAAAEEIADLLENESETHA